MGILCNGFEGKLSVLYADIIANNANNREGCKPTMGKKGMRELNNLSCSINYDVHSGSASHKRITRRACRDHL